MKESKVLKIVSYLLIPILVAMMLLSFLANYVQNYQDVYAVKKEYFSTDSFVERYMRNLFHYADCLIYQNENYPICYDEGVQISYVGDDNVYETGIEDCYILILYKDKAITNVELTSETNTIEKIRNYMAQKEDSKMANIVGGNVESNSDVVANKAIKHFDDFKMTYYTIDDTQNAIEITEELEELEELESSEESVYEIMDGRPNRVIGGGSVATKDIPENRRYVTTSIQDFAIYSTYKEELKTSESDVIIHEFLDNFSDLGSNIQIILPACLGVLLVISLYLVVSLGHTKGKEGIDLNDLDNIPYEWIAVIFLIGFTCVMFGLNICDEVPEFSRNAELLISSLLMIYIIGYVICAVVFDTTVKRIKAKTLIKNTICYRCCRWMVRTIKKIIRKMKQVWDTSTQSIGIVKKLVVVMVGYVVIAIILLGMFAGFGLFLDLVLAAFILYKIIERINCFTKIEKHLKEMYEGNHPEKLKLSDFTSEFQNTVLYINDIANGFENAIQEGIKSEKLKTELITNVSHDIRTPLTSIINYVDLLKKEEIENEKAKEYMEVLDNKSQRLKKLTEDLIEASKASSGNVKLNLEKLNIAELIKQSTGEFEDKFKAKNLEIMMNIPNEAICILADSRYMYRVIENIFSNVAKYSMEHSRVYIDVVKKEKQVYIAVKNISKEVLNISEEELMQRFVRGDKSRTTEGSGLGISISKSLAELQKGELKLKIDGDLFKVELIFDVM